MILYDGASYEGDIGQAPRTTSYTLGQLATAIPGDISPYSQTAGGTPIDASITYAGWLPTTIYIPENPGPIYRTETQQLDLLRVLMIVVGVIIGAKLLR